MKLLPAAYALDETLLAIYYYEADVFSSLS